VQYFGARYYDPAIGPFMAMTRDRLRKITFMVSIATVRNNNHTGIQDPNGSSPFDIAFLGRRRAKLGVAVYPVERLVPQPSMWAQVVGLSSFPRSRPGLKALRAAEHAAEAARFLKSSESGEKNTVSATRRAEWGAVRKKIVGAEESIVFTAFQPRRDAQNQASLRCRPFSEVEKVSM